MAVNRIDMKKRLHNSLYAFFSFLALGAQARENVTNGQGPGVGTSPMQTLSYNCAAGTAQTLLDINNVKTTILIKKVILHHPK